MRAEESTAAGEADRLAALAAAGDRAAAARYLQNVLPYLKRMANHVTPPPLDPDDVLSEALSRLLRKWNQGTGPQTHAHTYVIRTMRNIVVDEYRASRSRDVPLGLEGMPTDESVDDSLREIELDGEFTLIREAFRSLPEDQRKVLDAVTVQGRKPSELTGELGRNAAAVSNLLRRAKLALRRATLVSTLRRGHADCAANAAHIPRTPQPEWQAHEPAAPGLAHIGGCRTCQDNWRRWATLTSALGVTTVLVVSSVSEPPAAVALSPLRHGSRHRVVERGTRVISRALTGLTPGAMSVAAGSTLAAVGLVTLLLTSAAEPPAHFTAEATSPTTLSLSFVVDAETWRADSIALTIEGGRLGEMPPAWRCETRADTVVCDPGPGPIDAVLTVVSDGTTAAPAYRVVVHARAGQFEFEGTATGSLPHGAAFVTQS
ncbi:RNA polymerase sigma factor, sigma-70 family [Microbacterium testaceum StLB037]|uniref:RNA polymerase sigma factor, sigma-70 family n=1 Tax=Microbacterium testaceum (strain StLB037) TaxID=979556 RepID=A0A1H0QVJ6_MICTS|nr:sigma-70 family RNA polymerase sigma factor [Microbacterium testaceum]SDP21155.1 RNA polymerase sigma factor, sigma-70 family [Microbacterium testaceum StLB037]